VRRLRAQVGEGPKPRHTHPTPYSPLGISKLMRKEAANLLAGQEDNVGLPGFLSQFSPWPSGREEARSRAALDRDS
jgi:hypothetical protein